MPLLVPDLEPPTIRDRLKIAGYGAVALCAALFMLWYAPQVADPSWKRTVSKLRYLDDLTPFWRGASVAILGSWFGLLSLVGFWKAVRPFTPPESRLR
ncbi:hypothetical protein [Methylobacterium gregans]|uniref:Transmembrane protein n=1 Tax=Methylobacterium gregans TaxID=374424 RepID=A0AA37HUD6_9HYPH|nr:hypothetical protein [Methylobacterium gregans]MDQ0523546.1 TRAP-type C4-dicarboxylate transport system permease small subunit [Methylobacterium gregans]GJD80932.1 hypothetical protein NBEOAGPD_4176 [Methylobacterium gregans]GLS55894.1 hypothetical protein GCM10007886_40790 [Methylobacterium gregans]